MWDFGQASVKFIGSVMKFNNMANVNIVSNEYRFILILIKDIHAMYTAPTIKCDRPIFFGVKSYISITNHLIPWLMFGDKLKKTKTIKG